MDIEQIKIELTDRVTKVSNDRKNQLANLNGLGKLSELKIDLKEHQILRRKSLKSLTIF